MKITYTPNPLNTAVELNAQELELFRSKLKIKQYEELLFSAHWGLTRTPEYLAGLPRPSTVEKDLDPSYWCDDENKLDKRIDELL